MFRRLNHTLKMELKLNKLYLLPVFLLVGGLAFAQEERIGDKDYKDGDQFEQFAKKRKLVSAWQISQLKEGALVVRLKTNNLLVNALLKQGKTLLAEQKRVEMLAINRNTMRAYLDHYNFSKLYFIYSNSSDSLLKGFRSNIFVDTAMTVNPSIVMTEKFYLLAERDQVYNSTIGFVPEDSASVQREKGNGAKEMAVVVKNKYGHQLKKPFPYSEKDKTITDSETESSTVMSMNVNGLRISFMVDKKGKMVSLRNENIPEPGKTKTTFNYRESTLTLYIPKYLTYGRLSASITDFNANLHRYYRGSPHIDENRIDPAMKPFLY